MREALSTSAQTEGQRYLDSVPLEQRRAGGQVYTPPHLADFVLEQAGFRDGTSGGLVTLLDPSCGAGVFLERAVSLLADRIRGTRPRWTKAAFARALADGAEASLFGVDVEETACAMTRDAVRRAVSELTGLRLRGDYFRSNVVQADFLFSDEIARLSPSAEGFSFIVGNPPYVAATRIDAGYKDRLRGSFESASGRVDLYTVFMERSLGLLAVGGRFALLTPDKFLISQSARALRALLLQKNALISVARFRSHKIFDDAATVPCVTVVERGGRARDVAILECADRPDEDGRVSIVERRKVNQGTLSSRPWHVHALDRHELARKLQGAHPTLEHLTMRISAGPATGRDGVFVFPRGAHPEIERSLLRHAVRGRDLAAFRIDDPGLDVLVPFTFDAAGNSTLVDIAKFPGARRYLQRHRAELEARHCVRVWEKRWFDIHDQMPIDLARQTKILVPDVANSNRFVVDRGGFLPLHSVYYVLPRHGINVDYLCAILNSRVARFLVSLFSPVVKDGFNRYRQQFLATLPVPLVSTDHADEIAALARDGHSAELDARVARLFKLTMAQYLALDAHNRADGDVGG